MKLIDDSRGGQARVSCPDCNRDHSQEELATFSEFERPPCDPQSPYRHRAMIHLFVGLGEQVLD